MSESQGLPQCFLGQPFLRHKSERSPWLYCQLFMGMGETEGREAGGIVQKGEEMGKLMVSRFVIGMVGTNCYLVWDEETKEGVVIDPAENGQFILGKCQEAGMTLTAILLTHGHFDHIGAVEEIRRAIPVPVYVGTNEKKLLGDPEMNLSRAFGNSAEVTQVSLVKDQQILRLAGRNWKVISTPGHTKGSVCYYLEEEKILFSGDTLFFESYGRTDFPTGNPKELRKSVVEILFHLPDEVTVYPGHEAQTTIGHEKKYNPLASY